MAGPSLGRAYQAKPLFMVAEISGKWLPRMWPCLWTSWLGSKGSRRHTWSLLTPLSISSSTPNWSLCPEGGTGAQEGSESR